MVLHGFGKAESQVQFLLGAPKYTTLVQLERILAYEAGGGDSNSSSRTIHRTVSSAVEYFLDMEEVTSSNLVPSTKTLDNKSLSCYTCLVAVMKVVDIDACQASVRKNVRVRISSATFFWNKYRVLANDSMMVK